MMENNKKDDEECKKEMKSLAANFLPAYQELKFSKNSESKLSNLRRCLAVKYLTARSE